MAGEIILSFQPSKTVYFHIFNKVGQIYNTSTTNFEAYAVGNLANYSVAGTQQGGSTYYIGTFPATIAAGVYSLSAKQQIGGAAAETDPTLGTEDFQWNGSAVGALSDTATSGQLGQIGPIRLARGTMVKNFTFYLRSATDHSSPFTSGICSGQISRDGGAFGALQSGAFSEIGLGFYSAQALTSGDLLATTAGLVFTGTGVSGGVSDPCPLALILQRTSGQ